MPLTPGQVSTMTRQGGGGGGGGGGTANGTGMTNNAAAAAFVFNSGAAAAADLFWRYHHHHPHHGGAFNFPPSPTLLPPTPFPSPLDFKHHLPANLSEYFIASKRQLCVYPGGGALLTETRLIS